MNTNFSVCDHCGAFVPGDACPHCKKRSFHINKRVAAAALLGTTLFALTPACAYGNCVGLSEQECSDLYRNRHRDAALDDAQNKDGEVLHSDAASGDAATATDARADAANAMDAK